MGKQKLIFGARPPSFVSKATLAAELDISESTVDEWVRRGFLPQPIRRAGSVRWCWAEVNSWLKPQDTATDEDKFLSGIDNV